MSTSTSLPLPPPPPAPTTTMSSPPSAQLDQPHTSQAATSASIQYAVDVRLERMHRNILPTEPYLLRLTPGALHLAPDKVSSWRKGTHFDANEEELQYLTFRQNHDGSILHAYGQWSDGNGGIPPPEDPASRASNSQTPMPGQAKKKITLAEYRNRDKTKTSTSDVKSAAAPVTVEPKPIVKTEMPKEHVQTAEIIKASELVSKKKSSESNGTPAAADITKKRSHQASNESATETDLSKPQPEAPPAKKVRVSPKMENGNSATTQKTNSKGTELPQKKRETIARPRELDTDDEITSMIAAVASDEPPAPPALSVTSNGQIQPIYDHGLPVFMSPTLPQDIEDELARRSSRPPQVAEDDDDSINETKPSPSLAASQQKSKSAAVNATKIVHAKAKETLIVVLKIKSKANRKQLSRYLNIKPTPHALRHYLGEEAQGVSIKQGPTLSKTFKRQVSDDDEGDNEPLAKRRKAPGWVAQKTTTPKPHHHQTSPATSRPSSSSKNHLATPVNGLKSTAMNRNLSQESLRTPVQTSQTSQNATPRVPVNKGDSPERQKWLGECNAEYERLMALAKEIKHDSDKGLKNPSSADKGKKLLGVVTVIEAVLCFLLTAMVKDEPTRPKNQTTSTELWKSTSTFVAALIEASRPYRHLYGLLQQLYGLINDTICYHQDIRIGAIFREYERLKGQEVVDQTANAEAYINKYYHGLLKERHDVENRSRTAWREGEAALYHIEIAEQFPETWAGQRKYPGRGKGRDPVYLRNYAGDGYALPMGVNSTGLEAVNFGLALLEEFSKKENIPWQPKLKL